METNTVISTVLFVLSIQMAVFMWMWVFAMDKQQSLAQLYVGSWKKVGGVVGWLIAPFFKKTK